jgi:hypothetical protein
MGQSTRPHPRGWGRKLLTLCDPPHRTDRFGEVAYIFYPPRITDCARSAVVSIGRMDRPAGAPRHNPQPQIYTQFAFHYAHRQTPRCFTNLLFLCFFTQLAGPSRRTPIAPRVSYGPPLRSASPNYKLVSASCGTPFAFANLVPPLQLTTFAVLLAAKAARPAPSVAGSVWFALAHLRKLATGTVLAFARTNTCQPCGRSHLLCGAKDATILPFSPLCLRMLPQVENLSSAALATLGALLARLRLTLRASLTEPLCCGGVTTSL